MEFIFVIIILIMSVVIHEVAHGFAALSLGDTTAKYEGRLTLNPLAHFDPVGSFIVPLIGYLAGGFIIGWAKPVPFNPYNLRNQRWGEAIVAGAGAFSNLLLALVFGLVIRFSLSSGLVNENFLSLMGSVVFINLTLAVFNLIPIPPLDGSKILLSVLSYNKFQKARYFFERYGLVLVFVFIFAGWPIINPIIHYLFSLITGIVV